MTKFKTVVKKKDLGRVQNWFILGPDKALIADALDLARAHVYSDDFSVTMSTFAAGDDGDDDILNDLLQPTLFEDRHVTMVFDAEKIKNWGPILDAIKAREPSRFFIAVSNDDSIDKTLPLPKYLASSSKSLLVECGNMKDQDIIAWIESRLEISRSATHHLIELSRGDNEWLLNAMKKLELLDRFVSRSLLDKVDLGHGQKSLRDAFIVGDKKAIFEACSGNTLNYFNLDDIISTMMDAFLVNESLRSSPFDRRVLRDKTSMTMGQINKVKPIVKIFDRTTMSRRLSELSRLESQLRRNNKYAIEALTARW